MFELCGRLYQAGLTSLERSVTDGPSEWNSPGFHEQYKIRPKPFWWTIACRNDHTRAKAGYELKIREVMTRNVQTLEPK